MRKRGGPDWSSRLEHQIADTIRLAFAFNSFTRLPDVIAKLIAGSEVMPERVEQLALAVWEEQVDCALEDGVLTETESRELQAAMRALGIQAEGSPAYHRMVTALLEQGRELDRPRITTRRQARLDRFKVAIIGESQFQPWLCELTSSRVASIYAAATIEPEWKSGLLDLRAIRVQIHGQQVGFLSRCQATLYRRRYEHSSVLCEACISGGGDNLYGVWLDVRL